MSVDCSEPTRSERLVAKAVHVLRSVGLGKLVESRVMRRLGKGLLRRPTQPMIRSVVTGVGRGLRLQVLPGTPQSYWMGAHEPDVQALFQTTIKPGMVVYDCGANIGFFSLLLARLVGPGGRVFAFEPSSGSLACLEAGIGLNGFGNVTPVPEAVWHQTEVLRFVRGESGASLASDHVVGTFGDNVQEGWVEVNAVSLDEFVYARGNPAPDFVKIDVEGAEGHALRGARRLLAERRPQLLLEIHGEPGREVWSLLKQHRYEAHDITTGKVPQTENEFAVWISQYLARPA